MFGRQHLVKMSLTDVSHKRNKNNKDYCWILRRLLLHGNWKSYDSKALQTAMKEDRVG